MPRPAWISWLSALVLTALAGCADNPMVLQGRVAEYRRQQDTLAAQNRQLQDRAASMERDNQDLVTQLAQARQQTRVSEDQLAAVREQLRSATSQLTQAQTEGQQSEQKAQALTASLHRQGGVSISPNNSYLQTLPVIQSAGHLCPPRRRRDSRRVAGQSPVRARAGRSCGRGRPTSLSTPPPNSAATTPIRSSASRATPTATRSWAASTAITTSSPSARAMAVYNVLTASTQLRAEQLFVVGHGANHPVVSNGYTAGEAA